MNSSTGGSNPLLDVLKLLLVGNVLPERKERRTLLALPKYASMEQALSVLADSRIASLPVFEAPKISGDEATKSDNEVVSLASGFDDAAASVTELPSREVDLNGDLALIGSIDVLDIVARFASRLSAVQAPRTPALKLQNKGWKPRLDRPAYPRLIVNDFQNPVWKGLKPIIECEFLEDRIGDVMNFSSKNPFLAVNESQPIFRLIQTFGSGNVHRALITSSATVGTHDGPVSKVESALPNDLAKGDLPIDRPLFKDVVGMITQGDLIRMFHRLFAHMVAKPILPSQHESSQLADDLLEVVHRINGKENLIRMSNMQLRELGLATTSSEADVVAMPTNSVMLEVLKKLVSKSVSVIALIDPKTGRLSGSICGSDLRSLRKHDLNLLVETATVFLEKMCPSSLVPVTICRHDTFYRALELLSEKRERRIHHLFLTDDQQRPAGIVTMTDIMRVVYDFRIPGPGPNAIFLGELTVTIHRARNLNPSKKRSSGGRRNAYVAVKVPLERSRQTFVCYDSAEPNYRGQSFKFRITTAHYQTNESLHLSVYDKRSAFRADKLLGCINLDMAFVCSGFGFRTKPVHQVSGKFSRQETFVLRRWIPLCLNDNRKVQSSPGRNGELLVQIIFDAARLNQ